MKEQVKIRVSFPDHPRSKVSVEIIETFLKRLTDLRDRIEKTHEVLLESAES